MPKVSSAPGQRDQVVGGQSQPEKILQQAERSGDLHPTQILDQWSSAFSQPQKPTFSSNSGDVCSDDEHIYGEDAGLQDLDIPSKDDGNILDGSGSSEPPRYAPDMQAYYLLLKKLKIPGSLQSLPSILGENRWNLESFHFFIDKTATLLVACEPPPGHTNPFQTVLPRSKFTSVPLSHSCLRVFAHGQ